MNELSLKESVDNMLEHFKYNKSKYEEDSPEILYLDNGYSIQEEDREYTFETIAGERTETRTHYVLLRQVVEYNYPSEPDLVDVAEVGAFLDPLAAVAEMIQSDLREKIDGYLVCRLFDPT